MGIHDFKYPIMPDRVYTIKVDNDTYEVRGKDLIQAYMLSQKLPMPPQIGTQGYLG
jgi:hypothetical protein